MQFFHHTLGSMIFMSIVVDDFGNEHRIPAGESFLQALIFQFGDGQGH